MHYVSLEFSNSEFSEFELGRWIIRHGKILNHWFKIGGWTVSRPSSNLLNPVPCVIPERIEFCHDTPNSPDINRSGVECTENISFNKNVSECTKSKRIYINCWVFKAAVENSERENNSYSESPARLRLKFL